MLLLLFFFQMLSCLVGWIENGDDVMEENKNAQVINGMNKNKTVMKRCNVITT